MTARPVTHPESAGLWHPDPIRQKLASYTIEDILNLPPDAPRAELVGGVMQVVPSPTIGRQRISDLLLIWLHTHAPKHFLPMSAVGVAVGANETFEPDVVLVRRELDAELSLESHFFTPDRTEIVVEVVSPSTKKRDRVMKPPAYAAAGIRHFWRIEQDPVHVYAYRLSQQGNYELMADSGELLALTEPFPIKLPISEITP